MNRVLEDSDLYDELALIHKGQDTLVHRGLRTSDGVRVIRKSLRARHPTPVQRARQRHEYALLAEMQHPGIVRPLSLDAGANGPVITLADAGSDTLATRIGGGPLPLAEFLDMALSLVEALAYVHEHKIVHKDINPDNVLWDRSSGRALLLDFGIASRVARQYSTGDAGGTLEGTLAYLAPEQSGRTNRAIDWRTDFYGLGATFYEALYGRPPFLASDTINLVHAHLAKRPEPADDVRDDVPDILWQLVATLLAKSADDRYQSARGIARDLEQIRAAVAGGADMPDELVGITATDHFELPGRLYGRDRELRALREAWFRVVNGRAGFVAIRGPAGTGKSALVDELAPIVAEGTGYFVSGKFDRYQRDVPYSSLMQAASALLRQILAGSESQLARWRQRVVQAVGANGALIAESVPELETLIGAQDAPEALSVDESRNRFRVLLLKFFQALATPEHPVVLFLDDLQWADSASLDAVRALLTHNETRGLLIVGAFRDDELSASHPLKTLLDELASGGVRIDTIEPGEFSREDAEAMISEATHRPRTECTDLAVLLLERCGGRPFFLREYLLAASESGAIRFDSSSEAFSWDFDAIRSLPAQVELGGLLGKRIGRLPEPSRHALGVAACIGSTFDLATIAELDGQPVADVAAALEPAFEAGLAWGLGSWQVIDEVAEAGPALQGPVLCRFAHDEVQATAYDLVDRETRLDRHLRIAELLEQRHAQGERGDGIFDLVYQIRSALERISDEQQRLRYAALFLEAARKAAESAAFATASRFVRDGRLLLPEAPWQNHYELWLALSRIGAEAAALSGDKPMLDELVGEVRAHARTRLDETEVVAAQISYFSAHLQPAEALAVARNALHALGVELPQRASLASVASSLAITFWAMRGKSTEDLAGLPPMRDPQRLAAMRILLRAVSPAYIADPNMFPLIVLHMVRLSLAYGNSSESPFGYMTYGILLSAGLGRLERGTELGQFALRLAANDASDKLKAKLSVSYYVTLHHWKHHLAETLPALLASHHAGLETGDIEYACHSAWYYCSYATWSGEPLDEVAERQAELIAAIDEHKSEFHSMCGRVFQQFVQTLSQDEEGALPNELAGEAFDEHRDVARLSATDNFTALFCFHECRAALNYLLGDIDEAVCHGLSARRYEQNVLGSVNAAQNTFYLAMATLQQYAQLGPWQRLRARLRIAGCRRRLRRWAADGPASYLAKQQILEGEWQRLRGHGEQALACFDRARSAARSSRFLQDKALALERMARCELDLDMPLAAEENLRAAWEAWLSWGGFAKARQLESEFPKWLDRNASPTVTVLDSTYKRKSTGGTSDLATQLDLTSAMKASRAMVEEIVLESLLEKLMQILIENAGAQIGALVLDVDGEARLCAVGDVDRQRYSVIEPLPLRAPAAQEQGVRIPLRIVDYVLRSGDSVVLDDPASDPRFTDDPVLRGRDTLSALAAPLEHRGHLVGVIYLENSRTPAAFTEARVSMIQVLAAQAAISIQNARLYQELKDQADNLSLLNRSLGRFVPSQFLASLGHDSVTSVRLGENTHREMSVLFSDIRGFTSLVESMQPGAHVEFINEYLSYMEPAIVESGGFVDSYIGDAIMALFDRADDAVNAGLRLMENLHELNDARAATGKPPMRVRIGISTGPLTLGTIGGPQRIKCGVIGDTVNLAARIETLTTTYGVSLMISHHTRERLSRNTSVTLRQIERVTVKGQSQPVTLFEVLDALPTDERDAKMAVLDDWNAGMRAFYARDFNKASEHFGRVASSCSGDLAARRFVSNCWRYLDDGVPDNWDGIVRLDHK